MRLELQIAFWAAVLFVMALALWLLGSLMLPFAAALIIGYLLNPVADRLEGVGLNRLGASLVILLLFVLFVGVVLAVVVPILTRQFSGFVDNLPGYVARAQALAVTEGAQIASRWGGKTLERLGIGPNFQPADLQNKVGDIVGQALQWSLGVARGLWTGGQALIGIVSLFVVTPVVTFYFLLDWHRMIATVDRWIPLDHRATVRELAREIDRALAGFLRGQSLVCLLLGLWYGLGLSLVGLNFGLLIGITSGALSFIPYVGSLTALLGAALVGVVQDWPNWTLPAEAIGIVFLGQFLEANLFSPFLVGGSIGLHPVWVMFSLFCFGRMFGFAGLILAVPVSAAAAVLLRFGVRKYLASPIYKGVELNARESVALISAAPPRTSSGQ
jgi:predicted PurR-regulated permease PerM